MPRLRFFVEMDVEETAATRREVEERAKENLLAHLRMMRLNPLLVAAAFLRGPVLVNIHQIEAVYVPELLPERKS